MSARTVPGAIGHPISGDRTYRGSRAARLMLRADTLELPHPRTAAPLTIRPSGEP